MSSCDQFKNSLLNKIKHERRLFCMAPSEREGDMLAELVDDSSARLPVYPLRIIEKVRPLANNSTFSLYTRLTWLRVQSSKCRPFVLKRIFLVSCTKVRPGKKKKKKKHPRFTSRWRLWSEQHDTLSNHLEIAKF
jgi:hypothetical protein